MKGLIYPETIFFHFTLADQELQCTKDFTSPPMKIHQFSQKIMQQNRSTPPYPPKNISFFRAAGFLTGHKRLFGLSLLLFAAMLLLTWLGYDIALRAIDAVTSSFFAAAPETGSILGWLKFAGWTVCKWLYLFATRIIAFYLSFLLAYTLTSPGYGVLSASAEKIFLGKDFEDDELTVKGLLIDLLEAIKITLFGLVITIAALFINLIPLIGQALTFLVYIYYSALMFLDYPASRLHWHLGKKIKWMFRNNWTGLRLGILPTLVSLIPVLNVFVIALLFPVLTVQATLQFATVEMLQKQKSTSENQPYGD